MFISEDASKPEGHSRSGAGRRWIHAGIHRPHVALRGHSQADPFKAQLPAEVQYEPASLGFSLLPIPPYL